MHDTMRRLLVVQKIDTAISEAETALGLIPSERAAVESEIAHARAIVEQNRSTLEQEELEERQLESKMRDQEALLERLNNQCSQVTSNQAYEALQHEIEHAQNAGSDFETRALELMETIDTARTQLQAARQKLGEVEAAAPGQLDDIATRQAAHESERASLLADRAREIQDIDPKMLARYDRIATLRHPAVTILEGDTCPECNIKLPRMAISEIKRGEAIHGCTSCQRLLVPAQIVAG